MPGIDTNTLFIVLISLGAVMAIMLAIVGRGVDKSLLIWSFAFANHAAGFLLLILRGIVPDFLSIWLANGLIASTYALFAVGLLNFMNLRASRLLAWSPVIVMMSVFPFLMEQISARIILGGAINFAQMLILLAIIYNYRDQLVGRGKYILATCFVVGIPVSTARPIAVALGFADIASFDSPGPLQAFTFLAMTIINVVVALAFVLMQKEQAEAATDSIARSDELTGLPNRRRLYERIGKVMADTNSDVYSALILLDLDNFKTLNDSFGHAAGDELLKQAAQRLEGSVSRTDTVARLGGDEFVVLLADLGDNQDAAERLALATAKKIQAELAQPYELNASGIGQSADTKMAAESIIRHQSSGTLGIKVFRHGHPNREELLRDADKAMYTAKNLQRGSIQLAERVSAATP